MFFFFENNVLKLLENCNSVWYLKKNKVLNLYQLPNYNIVKDQTRRTRYVIGVNHLVQMTELNLHTSP